MQSNFLQKTTVWKGGRAGGGGGQGCNFTEEKPDERNLSMVIKANINRDMVSIT